MTVPRPSARRRQLDPERLGDHLDRLYRAAWAICGDRHDAEDLVQDTCARALARPRWLHRDDDVGYLLGVLRNTHFSRLRHAGRRPLETPLDERGDLHLDRDDRALDTALEAGELFAAIAALPDWAREAIAMVDVAGLSYGEAAAVLGIKEATLTTRLHRARRRVAGALAGDVQPQAARTA